MSEREFTHLDGRSVGRSVGRSILPSLGRKLLFVFPQTNAQLELKKLRKEKNVVRKCET